jgi:hypothetical protein
MSTAAVPGPIAVSEPETIAGLTAVPSALCEYAPSGTVSRPTVAHVLVDRGDQGEPR